MSAVVMRSRLAQANCFSTLLSVVCSVYARAFQEGFTITLVSGRTVGIGAYLARLGRRYGTPISSQHVHAI